eukprot:scaffold14061_cov118-Isochrysis_galbana.AAC.2
MWQLQDSHRLVVTVPKLQLDRQEWWPCLLVGDPEINTDRCRAGESHSPSTHRLARRRRPRRETIEPGGHPYTQGSA